MLKLDIADGALPREMQGAARAVAGAVRADPAREQAVADHVLIDLSRLVWRMWTGRLPTGIDRVCLAYARHYAGRARAVVQKGPVRLVLSKPDTARLIELLDGGVAGFRGGLLGLAPAALLRARTRPPSRGMLYLNIGHTGLDSASLPVWIARHGLRAVHLIHDLIPLTNPEFCRPGEDRRHEARIRHALESAAGIIANSHATLGELTAFAATRRIAMPPSTVAWLAGEHAHAHLAGGTTHRAGRPYFLVLGTIEGRKNHIMLLRLWRRLVERMGSAAPRLFIVGQRGWEADHVLAVLDRCDVLNGHVEELGRCTDDKLARLFAGARALLMPSFAEGFGLPLVEALAHGTPVIASDLPVFREIAGDIPQYIAPWDGVGWETAVIDFTGESAERERQVGAMRDWQPPDWPGHFAAIDAWLETLRA